MAEYSGGWGIVGVEREPDVGVGVSGGVGGAKADDPTGLLVLVPPL